MGTPLKFEAAESLGRVKTAESSISKVGHGYVWNATKSLGFDGAVLKNGNQFAGFCKELVEGWGICHELQYGNRLRPRQTTKKLPKIRTRVAKSVDSGATEMESDRDSEPCFARFLRESVRNQNTTRTIQFSLINTGNQ